MLTSNKTLLLLACLCLSACEESKYGIIEPKPTLSIAAPASVTLGAACGVQLAVQQQGATGNFSLSLLLLSGQATARIENTNIPTSGTWTTLSRSTNKLTITPTAEGLLSFYLQAQSADGIVSERQQVNISVTTAVQITAAVEHEALLLNPNLTSQLPIRLLIEKAGYEGTYAVTTAITKGSGKLYKNHYAVTDTEMVCGAETLLEYNPDILGEHIISFTIKQSNIATTTVTAYIDIAKEITVESIVSGAFTIKGTGRYNTDRKEVVLELVNNDKYNFAVAEWQDADGNVLAATPTCSLKLSKGCPSELRVKLARREVTLQRGAVAEEEFVYVVSPPPNLQVKRYYDHKTSVFSEHNVSDNLVFSHQGSKYNTAARPPVVVEFNGNMSLNKGTNWVGYFWQVFDDHEIKLRSAANPDLKFDYTRRYVDSPTTRYHIPSNITMQ